MALFFFSVAPHAFADGFVPLAPIPGLTQGVAADSAGLAAFFNNLYKYLIGLASILAVLMITWEGLRIATNQDNVSIITDSKGKIYNAIFGLVLVLSPALVFSIINPSILNLSVNLPPLDTRSGIPAGSNAVTSTTTVDAATGCTVTGTLLQKAVCPSTDISSAMRLAQQFVSNCDGYGAVLPITRLEESCQIVNGQRTCMTTAPAVCQKKLVGTYVTIDLAGTFAVAKLKPIGDNAASLTSFAAACVQDKGVVCGSKSFFSIDCPSNLSIVLQPGQSGRCYSIESISCGNGGGGGGGYCPAGSIVNLSP